MSGPPSDQEMSGSQRRSDESMLPTQTDSDKGKVSPERDSARDIDMNTPYYWASSMAAMLSSRKAEKAECGTMCATMELDQNVNLHHDVDRSDEINHSACRESEHQDPISQNPGAARQSIPGTAHPVQSSSEHTSTFSTSDLTGKNSGLQPCIQCFRMVPTMGS